MKNGSPFCILHFAFLSGRPYIASMRWSAIPLLLLAFAAFAGDDLAPLSDEFNDASTLSQWQRIYAVEGWGANQLERQDINAAGSGRMVMMPFTSTWYNDYRGELTFKTVSGDFVVTTDVEATSRSGSGPPRSQYSLGGIMVRVPRNVTPQTWRPGGENYVFLSLGAASSPGTFQNEVKTTVSSVSTLIITPAPSGRALIQVARIGPYLIMLRNSDGNWVVHRRYVRADFPQTLQVGMTTYTDYPTCSTFAPVAHNSTVIHIGTPDLIASFDYFRFARPNVPPALATANLTDPVAVSDAQLLSFLGANAAVPRPSHRRAVGH